MFLMPDDTNSKSDIVADFSFFIVFTLLNIFILFYNILLFLFMILFIQTVQNRS